MSKFTRRFKKNKKNRTIKRGGSSSENNKIKENLSSESPNKEKEGILDVIGNKITGVASSAATFVGDTGLRIIGLERVNKDEEKATEKVDENINKLTDSASEIVSDVGEVVDKTGVFVLKNVNNVLGSDAVQETTKEAAEKTADIVKEGAETFNNALNNPEVKAEVKEAIDHIGEIGSVVIGAAEKPIKKTVDVAANSAIKATGAALSGVIRVSTDAAAAIPYVGSFIEFGKMLNDGSKAASAVVEAGSESVEVASDAIIETKEAIDKGLKLLEQKKKFGHNISDRTDKSINEFENPISSQSGGRKTRRRLIKCRAKSKRVRFAI
jgi:hypothetical protein